MITENLSTLKIHKLTQEQYNRELEAGNIDPTALYLTPDDGQDGYDGIIAVPNGGTGLSNISVDNFLVGNGTDNMIEKTPAEVSEMLGIAQNISNISMVKSGSNITATITTENGNIVNDILLDANGYPSTIKINGIPCAVNWEGF